MDGDTTMSDNPSLNDLIQQAKSLGVWNDAYCGVALNDETQRSAFSLALQTLITITMETNELKAKTNELMKLKRLKAETNELEMELKRRSLEILKDDKRPLVNRTDSAPQVAELRYRPAKIKRVEYDFMNEINVPYGMPYVRGDKSIDSLADVKFFVAGILRPICSGVSSDIHISLNRRIFGIESDILLLHGNNRIPFAAVDIKKNGEEQYVNAIFKDDDTVTEKLKGKVQGEHLTQLNQIRLFGFNKVFGLISDGNHSMITCTGCFSQDEDLARSIKTPSKKRSAETMNEESQDASPDNAIRVRSMQEYDEAPDTLYCSHYSDVTRPEGWEPTVNLLTHFVRLALNTVESYQFSRDVPLETKLLARIIKLSQDGQSDMFAHSTIKFSAPLDLWKCLLTSTIVDRIYLFKHLGTGNNGECCLATTESTESFCAVKFFAEREAAKDCANREWYLWNTIYENELPSTRVIGLPPTSYQHNTSNEDDQDNSSREDDHDNSSREDDQDNSSREDDQDNSSREDDQDNTSNEDDQDNASNENEQDNTSNEDACLLMPYLLPIDGDDRRRALNDESIRDCLTFFAGKGYLHNEVKWCHLGFFRSDSESCETTKVYLCDLGSVQKRDKESESEWATLSAEWIEKSLKDLKDTAATEQ